MAMFGIEACYDADDSDCLYKMKECCTVVEDLERWHDVVLVCHVTENCLNRGVLSKM